MQSTEATRSVRFKVGDRVRIERDETRWPSKGARTTASAMRGISRWAGLRRGEVSGLRWSDIELDDDCDGGTLTIAHNRVSVGGHVHDTDPKTERSARTLPLTPALAKALKRAKALQAVTLCYPV